MAYLKDQDLEFLKYCDSKSLHPLVEILTKDKDGNLRLTEELTSKERYQKYYPKHSKYWQGIAEELQKFGGNTFANNLRGYGVLYREILCDVCDMMKVNYNKNAETVVIEQNLLMKILEKSMEKMSKEELKQLSKDLNLKTTNFTPQAIMAAIQIAISQGGFLVYQISVIVANAVVKALLGQGLTFAANAALTRAISIFAGPIGWVITGAWTAITIAGPAYRVTVPAVIHIAYLRQKHMNSKKGKLIKLIPFL